MHLRTIKFYKAIIADPSGHAIYGVGLRPLAYWDCGFESRWQHGCLSRVSVVSCQVDVSASSWSLAQRSPTERGVSECDREASIEKRPCPTGGCEAIEKKKNNAIIVHSVEIKVNMSTARNMYNIRFIYSTAICGPCFNCRGHINTKGKRTMKVDIHGSVHRSMTR